MERSREARRGAMPAVNGVLSASRRRQRSGGGLRDSPEDDGGGMEMQEGTTRLRERSKKERDRERSGRSKRRRVVMHGGGGREDGEETSEESVEDDEDEDFVQQQPSSGAVQSVRLPPPPPIPPSNTNAHNAGNSNNNSNSSMQQNQPSSSPNHQQQHSHQSQQQHRKGVPASKAPRFPGLWKASADEMIGVSVPRKARTASGKRSHECWVSGSGGGGGGGGVAELIHRQRSTSPARRSPSSSAPISPSSSNASMRKKLKPSSGNKHRLPKISKPQPAPVQDIEFEVAEVLFGMTRQFPGPPKQDMHKLESKDTAINGSSSDRVSSPNSMNASHALTQQTHLPSSANLPQVVVPKRKRPRPFKLEDTPVSPLNLGGSTSTISPVHKMDEEQQPNRENVPPVKSENIVTFTENGFELYPPHEASVPVDMQKEEVQTEGNLVSEPPALSIDVVVADREVKKEPAKQVSMVEDAKHGESTETKVSVLVESPGKEKISIDLMAQPLPEDGAVEECGVNPNAMVPEGVGRKDETGNLLEERIEESAKLDLRGALTMLEDEPKSTAQESGLGKVQLKERNFDLQLDILKQDRDEISNVRQQQQQQQPQKHLQLQQPQAQQQPKPSRTDVKSEKSVQPGSAPLSMNVAGWQPFSYMSQFPSLVHMDGNTGSAKPVQLPHVLVPPQRPKRCAYHCYIAQCIQYHQKMQQMNRFWPPGAAGATAFYGAKTQYNVNGLQPSDSMAILGNTLQGSGFPGRNIGTLQDVGSPAVAAAFGGLSSKDKNPVGVVSASSDPVQRKQLVLQQQQQGASANNMLAPAFVIPFNQQQAAALNRSATGKPSNGANGSGPSTSAPAGSSTVPTSGAANVSFNYASLPAGETPYVAILPNSAYPFPISAAHVGALPQFRGNSAQAMPFFNSSFYPSQMLHPNPSTMLHSNQLQQQSLQTQSQMTTVSAAAQQGHQSKTTSSGSSSSQKHQQQRVPGVSGASASHGFPNVKLPQHLATARPAEVETISEDAPSSADCRVPSAHKGMYNHNFSMPVPPQNFALMSPPSDKQTHASNLAQSAPSPAFTVSFPSLNGVTPPLGIDFSSTPQNLPLFQSMPEATRQNYQMVAVAAAAAVSQASSQQKKLETKSGVELAEEERKASLASKSPGNFSQHSLTFAASTSPSLSNTAAESSGRPVSLIQPLPSSSGRSSNRPASAAPSSTPAGAVSSFVSHQHLPQSHVAQQNLQRQHQQQILMHHQQQASRPKAATNSTPTVTSSSAIYSNDRLTSNSAIPKFQSSLGGFPQAMVVQGGAAGAPNLVAAANQSTQWKNASRSSSQVPIPSQSQPAISSSIKNQLSQQQTRGTTQPSSLPNQTQISFSVAVGAGSSQKLLPQTGQQLAAGSTGNPSPQPSLSKGGGSGSPRSSTISSKQGSTISGTLPIQQQPQQPKSSPANSNHKSSPVSNRNAASILGQPHLNAHLQGSGSKQQMDQMQQFQQAQFYFSGAYIPAATAQANSMVQGYYQKQPQQQQSHSQQHTPPPTSSAGVLSLCSPVLTLGGATATIEPGKSSAASNMKNLSPQNMLQAAAHIAVAAAAGGTVQQRPLMSSSGFPYVHSVSPVPVKPVEQKPATGNDNLHACWQPEKR